MWHQIREVYFYREMLKNLVSKELRARYKGSVLGFLWTFFNPLLMLIVYSVVFSFIMRIETENYAMFLFVAMYLAAVFAYPAKSLKGNKLNASAFYIRQKNCDFLLVASTFCMIVFFSNQPDKIFSFSIPLNATAPATSSLPIDSTVKNYKTIAAFCFLEDENGKSEMERKKETAERTGQAIKKTPKCLMGQK